MSENGRPDDALRTPWQIRTADLDRLRMDDRLWAAYERGWCDFLQMYMDSKLMQGETDYLTLQPVDREDGGTTARDGDGRDRAAIHSGGRAAAVQDPQPTSADARDSPPSSTDADDSAPSSSDVTARLTSPSTVEDLADDAQPPPPPPIEVDEDEERMTETDQQTQDQQNQGQQNLNQQNQDQQHQVQQDRHRVECTESSAYSDSDRDDDNDLSGCYDASGSDDGGTDSHAGGYASHDSSRDADAEVRRVMFGGASPDSSEAEAMRSFSVHGPFPNDSVESSE